MVPGQTPLKEATELVKAHASIRGPEHEVFQRVAEHNGAVWIYLGGKDGKAVEITAAGWKVHSRAATPVRFNCGSRVGELPAPEEGGTLDDLWRFVNLKTKNEARLFATVITSYLRPNGPYVITRVVSEAGGGKTSACRVIAKLTDPWAWLNCPT